MNTFIFNQKLLKKKYDAEVDLAIPEYTERRAILGKWYKLIKDGRIDAFGETQLRESFIIEVFEQVLKYATLTNEDSYTKLYNLKTEQKTKVDGKTADAILGYFNYKQKEDDIRVAIELKGPTANLDAKQTGKTYGNLTPIEQGFGYLPKYGRQCSWLIVSNYKEIRLYHASDATQYESFFIKDIYENDDIFKKFLYILSSKSLISQNTESRVDRLWTDDIKNEEKIEKDFYEKYKKTRIHLFNDICENNKDVDTIVCLSKTQKILDRFIFICFAEDKGLLPSNIFNKSVKMGTEHSLSRYGVWEEVKGLFESIDLGNQGHDINRFNGGLFSEDIIINSLKIPNSTFEYMNELSQYDFDSDLNENILGHIFEKSISDLEDMREDYNSQRDKANKKDNKRNKDGIFYTPKYITKHIVENSIGGYLEKARVALNESKLPELSDNDYNSKQMTSKLKRHIDFWTSYRDIVLNIKILDPACGSGAFLNEAFDYLYKVGHYVNDTLSRLTGTFTLFDFNKNILKNNLYGVDLNEESVEMTKLSLWLKTANKNSSLTSLDKNIKCGNSLIDDVEIEPHKSFDWNIEFKEIMDNGGFDVIIGNPPYVATKMIPESHREYYWGKYSALLKGEMDLYQIFLYEFSKNKLKKGGFLGFITPNTYFTNSSFLNLRHYLINEVRIETIIDFPYRFFPFEDVNKETAILLIQNIPDEALNRNMKFVSIDKDKMKSLKVFNPQTYKTSNDISKTELVELLESNIVINADKIVLKMMKSEFKLKKHIEVHKGWMSVPETTTCNGITYDKKILSKNDIKENESLVSILKECLEGKDINRYGINNVDKYVNIENIDKDTLEWHYQPKIVLQRIVGQNKSKIRAFADFDNHIIFPNANIINILDRDEDILFYLGLLNSKLIGYFYNLFYGESNTNITKGALENIPVVDFNKVDKSIVINCSGKLIEKYREFDLLLFRFLNNIFGRLRIEEKPSTKLLKFYTLSLDEFIKEIEKRKSTKLSLIERDELEDFFFSYKDKMNSLSQEICEIENTLNNQFYNFYDLTSEESKHINDNFKNILFE